MKTLFKIAWILVLCGCYMPSYSQSASELIQAIERSLSKNDCSNARRRYEAYKQITGKTNAEIEARIKECESPTQAVTNTPTTDTWRDLLSKAVQTNPTHKYNDGGFYKGGIDTYGKRHGLGIYYWENGTMYMGEFIRNVRTGHGIYIPQKKYTISNFDKAVYYVGPFNNGDFGNGIGSCYNETGQLIYYGNVRDDKPTETYPNRNGGQNSTIFKELTFDNGRYIGETYNGRMNGYGVYLFSNGDFWYGLWKEGVRKGKGIYVYASGTIQSGTWDNNTRTAPDYEKLLSTTWRDKLKSAVYQNPTQTLDNGRYKGQTDANNKRSGLGIYAWDDGGVYLGGWENDSKNGYGIYIADTGYYTNNCPDASYYVGPWANDQIGNGKGTCYDDEGDLIYYGEFSANKPTETYPLSAEKRKEYEKYKFRVIEYTNGNTYIGETVDGKRGGYGIFLWKDGDLWYGPWKDGSRSGQGILIRADGSILRGRWDGDTYTEE
ncbi:MAG: hypothetical protein LBN06_00725 [Prevotellaceae bacterium]|jgi:hypothetical protein|nr:hypothetical protein [Prevotellaceae bacterium]